MPESYYAIKRFRHLSIFETGMMGRSTRFRSLNLNNIDSYLRNQREPAMATLLQNGQILLFIGDSITDCDRRTTERPLGNGYVKIFYDLLMMREPAKKIHILNKGISGDRVTGLQTRWQDNVLRNQPDWLVIKIGINDLNSYLTGSPDGVSPELFRQTYDEILGRTQPCLPNCQILLITPFYISIDDSTNSYRREVLELLPQYINTVQVMSQKYQTRFLNAHQLFQQLLKYHEPETFCPEPIHPNFTGHLTLAEAVYSALSE